MNIWQLLQSKVPEMIQKSSTIPITEKHGRVFHAKVTEQLDGALFSVQKSGTISQVTIQGKVEVGKVYTFEVRHGSAGVYLTPVMENSAERTPPFINSKHAPVTSSSNIPAAASQTTQERVQVMTEQLGVRLPRNEVNLVVKELDRLSGLQKEAAFELTRYILHRDGTRFESEKLQMLLTVFTSRDSSLESLRKVEQILQQSSQPGAQPNLEKMQSLLESLLQPRMLDNQTELIHMIKQTIPLLGLNYEQGLGELLTQKQSFSSAIAEQLKPLLMDFHQKVTTAEEKIAISQLVSKLTGFQLLSREEGSLHHLFIPLPIQTEKEAKDWYVHISSKKKNNTLDPGFCRIVFLIDLPVFSSIMVDLFIQQKVVSLSFYHTYKPLEHLVESSVPMLKQILLEKGYTLTSVKAELSTKEGNAAMPLFFLKTILTPTEKGLDIKV
jgi:hypothetical protein